MEDQDLIKDVRDSYIAKHRLQLNEMQSDVRASINKNRDSDLEEGLIPDSPKDVPQHRRSLVRS